MEIRMNTQRSRAVFEREQQYIVGLSGSSSRSGLAFARGNGCVIEDMDGNQYLDFTAGVGIMSTGHCHPRVVSAVREQVGGLVGFHDACTEPRVELFELLAANLPKRLRHFAMFSGGAETVESALRFSRAHTGQPEVVSFWGGFHGKTLGALSVTGHETRHYWPYPGTAGFATVPYADCYRCPLSLSLPTCGTACARFAQKAIERSTYQPPAAVVMEPMQGTQGNIIPPREFVEAIGRWCREHGVLLIFDEILVGCGRTGKLFAFEHYDVEPDILLLGKGLGSGFPIGVVALSEELATDERVNKASGASTSFGGNPVSAAAARATLETILSENLIDNARVVGERLLTKLQALSERHPLIGDVRGRGLLIGVVLVRNRESREGARKEGEAVVAAAMHRGLMLMSSTGTLRINPPLILTAEQADHGVAILEEALAEVEAECYG